MPWAPPAIHPRRDVFSRAGSWLNLLFDDRRGWGRPSGDGLYLRHCHDFGGSGRHLIHFAAVRDGVPVPWEPEADACEWRMRLVDETVLRCCFAEGSVLVAELAGTALRLTVSPDAHAWCTEEQDGSLHLSLPQSRHEYRLRVVGGRARPVGHRLPMAREPIVLEIEPGPGGTCSWAIEELAPDRPLPAPQPIDYPAALSANRAALVAFRAPFGPAPADPELARAWESAIACLWALQVGPLGHLERPVVYMSKYVMNAIWSWDSCFNALALAGAHDALAVDQILVFFRHQSESGLIPDCITDARIQWSGPKPPLHGWCLRELERRGPLPPGLDPQRLYRPLAQLTRWWLERSRWPGETLPHYRHPDHSGWDNSTVFDGGGPVQTPDLAAFLVIQCELLSEWAPLAGAPAEAGGWAREAVTLQAAARALLCGPDGLQARRLHPDRGPEPISCRSLLPSMGLLLGTRLPASVRAATVARIRAFLTPHGLATELPGSPVWRDDHFYWRGPAWAPTTHLAVSALDAVGEGALATEIAERFCRTCARVGFWENVDSRDGSGQCDSHYSWTAGICLDLIRRLGRAP